MKRLILITLILIVLTGGLRQRHQTSLEFHEIKPFEVLKQPDHITCGPTSVTMVLKQYGKNVKIEEVRKATKTDWITVNGNKIGTTSPDFIVEAMKGFGVSATRRIGTLDELRYYVSCNRPPIIITRTGKYLLHYVVVIGFNKDNFILADPCGERYEIKNEVLLSAWSFTTDMLGNPVSSSCPLCFGSGNVLGIQFNPITFCELCNGTGRMMDWVVLGLIWADVYPNTMIVPDGVIK